MVVQFIFLLNSANLICRGTDISKCLGESLGLRDNESRLYIFVRYGQTFYGTKPSCSEDK